MLIHFQVARLEEARLEYRMDLNQDLNPALVLIPNLEIEIRSYEGVLLEVVKTHNIITNSGLQQVRDLIGYPAVYGPGYTPAYIAIGSGSSAPSMAQTTLDTEVFRNSCTRRVAEGPDKMHYQLFVSTTEANGSGTQLLNEVGLFSLSYSGSLWARAIYAQITKTSSISVTYNWRITLANG